MTFRATLEKVWKRLFHFTTAVKIDSKTRLEQNEAHKNLCFICGDENMDLILAPVKLQSKDLNVMLVFQLLLRARGRNHLTPLSTALSTPGSRSNVVTSSRTQHFVLLRYNFVTSFNFLSTAQPRGDEMNRTQKSYARCLSYPIPHA